MVGTRNTFPVYYVTAPTPYGVLEHRLHRRQAFLIYRFRYPRRRKLPRDEWAPSPRYHRMRRPRNILPRNSYKPPEWSSTTFADTREEAEAKVAEWRLRGGFVGHVELTDAMVRESNVTSEITHIQWSPWPMTPERQTVIDAHRRAVRRISKCEEG